jgi:hypothetical protein
MLGLPEAMWQLKKLELLRVMADSLGYKGSIDSLDLFRTYGPQGLVNQQQLQADLSSELLRVLKATGSINVTPEPQTGQPGPTENGHALPQR